MKTVCAFLVVVVLAVVSPALAAAPFTVTPKRLDFTKTEPGVAKTFTVRKSQGAALSISITGSPFVTVTPMQATVSPGDPQIFSVTWNYGQEGGGSISVLGAGKVVRLEVANFETPLTPTPTPSPTPSATPTVVGEPSPTPTLPMITPVPPSTSPVSQGAGLLNLFRQIW